MLISVLKNGKVSIKNSTLMQMNDLHSETISGQKNQGDLAYIFSPMKGNKQVSPSVWGGVEGMCCRFTVKIRGAKNIPWSPPSPPVDPMSPP